MYGLGLYPLIERLSRITINSCTLIDNIFTNQINYFANSGLLISDICDHLPMNMDLKKITLRPLEMYKARKRTLY